MSKKYISAGQVAFALIDAKEKYIEKISQIFRNVISLITSYKKYLMIRA